MSAINMSWSLSIFSSLMMSKLCGRWESLVSFGPLTLAHQRNANEKKKAEPMHRQVNELNELSRTSNENDLQCSTRSLKHGGVRCYHCQYFVLNFSFFAFISFITRCYSYFPFFLSFCLLPNAHYHNRALCLYSGEISIVYSLSCWFVFSHFFITSQRQIFTTWFTLTFSLNECVSDSLCENFHYELFVFT